MPHVTEKTAFRFDDLSDTAKERARDWWRSVGLDYDWWKFTCEDFDRIASTLGVDVTDKEFSGFWSQGDGARFFGSYSYAKGAARAIRDYAPKDSELHAIADALQTAQSRVFYQAVATISPNRGGGNCGHEMTMSIDVEPVDGRDWSQSTYDDTQEAITDAMRDLARWLYRALEREYEYLTSDENVDESIAANGYEFDESGRPL